MVRLVLKASGKPAGSNSLAPPPKPEASFADVLHALRVREEPSVLQDLRLQHALVQIDSKLKQLHDLETVEGEAYRVEVLAVTDPQDKEDYRDIRFASGQAVVELFVRMGVLDVKRNAVVTIEIVTKAVHEARRGINETRKAITEAVELERARDEDLRNDIDALKELLDQQSKTGGLLRPIYIPPATKARQTTLPSLEGDNLIVPTVKYNDPRARNKIMKQQWEGMQPGEWLPTKKRPIAKVKEDAKNTGEGASERISKAPIANNNKSQSPPPQKKQKTTPKTTQKPTQKTPKKSLKANPYNSFQKVFRLETAPGRGIRTNHNAPRWTIAEKIALLRVTATEDARPYLPEARSRIITSFNQATGTDRAWNSLRLMNTALRSRGVTIEDLEKQKQEGNGDADEDGDGDGDGDVDAGVMDEQE